MFKDMVMQDLNVFFNMNELAETHTMNNHPITCIIDSDKLIDRSKKEYDGITVGEILLFAKKSDLKFEPIESMPIVFDGKQMYVFSVREDNEVYEIILSQNRG